MLPASVESFVALAPVQRRPIAQAVVAFAGSLRTGSRVLDAGAGTAPYRPLFDHCEYVTHDWPHSLHGAAADVVGDIAALPLADASFDAVVCTEVLEHVVDPVLALRELRRVLTPGAKILVTVPFVTELHEEPWDYARPTSYGLQHMLETAGFADVTVQPTTGWYSTMSQVLRSASLSTTAAGARPSPVARAVTFVLRVVSVVLARLAPALDARLDSRRALPLGWVAHARRPGQPGSSDG